MTRILEVSNYQEARAPDGLTASAWKDQLKSKYPEPAEGSCREVPPEFEDQIRIAQEAETYWRNQVATIKAQVREAMGGAETATIDGVPFMVRKLVPYNAYNVPAGFRDTLTPPARDED